jgi:hypothetical protein
MSTHLDLDDVCAGHPKAQQELDALRAELAEWRKLREPEALHVNLLRGQPAQLSRETFLHLAGADHVKDLNGDAGLWQVGERGRGAWV